MGGFSNGATLGPRDEVVILGSVVGKKTIRITFKMVLHKCSFQDLGFRVQGWDEIACNS